MTILYYILQAVALFVLVVLLVNAWIRYRIQNDDDMLIGRIYTSRKVLWLDVKCWAVLCMGLLLADVFGWMMDFVPATLYNLTGEFRVFFYVLCFLLTAAALTAIVLGEDIKEIRLRNAQSQNQLLKSQLNPHFLYNTLNNIDALIWMDQERASAAVIGLSSLMRYFTYSGRQDAVSIGEEVEHLRQLVELQRLRMPVAEALVFEVDVDDTKQEIAPLLLIPLVENCFKHCGDLNEPGAIRIRLSLQRKKMEFVTDNNLPVKNVEGEQEKSMRRPHGLGLKVLRRRLDLLYGNSYSFMLQPAEGRFVSRLSLAL